MLHRDQLPQIVLLAVVLLIVWSVRLLDIFNLPDTIAAVFRERTGETSDEAFIRAAAEVEFPTPMDFTPLRDVCTKTQFQPGLLFTCEGQHGGIGMVRNQILKCVRYAIHAGAALVVPSMALRNAKDITDIETTTEVPLDYLLDREAFVTRLSLGCPGMQIYNSAEEFPSYENRSGEPLSLLGDQFEPDHPREGLEHPEKWRASFDGWLKRHDERPRPEAPVHVQIQQSFLEYPVQNDGVAFAREFGKILSFREDTRELAAKVLLALKKKFRLPIDPSLAVNPGAFYGAHLRLEKDAIAAWEPEEWRFSRKDDQFWEQTRNLERSGLSVVYVASGDLAVVKEFEKYLDTSSGAREATVPVVTKYDLLKGADRRQLDALAFDQQALVDFLVMFKASAFMGVAHSSFPWTVALRRHELSRYEGYANEGSDILKDEYSVIMGKEKDYPYIDPFVTGIWP
ncbi:hypothetical protein F5X68DRAFT_227191 [Plectosphaerella plurivora]|uniref:Alternative oxidase n=1 Tax=Plectosphaerella plurivora TaxID=936078 RepID=A0A9P8VJ09_9PEZI|nr:hypothetical protein F5X68DRAFT_227191 [Plectosphaerella plurivora]